jgi:alkanesulfonate monooxygenase SsuD/methylene tetrahydromethanopterin reductase-like flavin-dependent oxidoreductase (luciferase family)
MTARMAAAVDDLSEGRLVLGLGAGWLTREHTNFGWELGDIPTRFSRFEEGLEVISRLLKSDTPVDFAGHFFQLKGAILLPRPTRSGGPPISIGGNGPKRTLPLVARFGDEWNAVYVNAVEFSRLNSLLDETLHVYGRPPLEVRRSLMTGCIFVRNESELPGKAKKWWNSNASVEELLQHGVIMGPPTRFVEQLGQLAEAGVQEVMLQWLDLDDLDGLESMARDVLDQV